MFGDTPVSAVILAAHPDDETIGTGGCVDLFSEVAIVHVTDGAPRDMQDAVRNGFPSRDSYAAARRQEFLDAIEAGGVPAAETIPLDFADQEASLHMPEIARELSALLARIRPALLFTHPYEGGHPDHDALAFAAHAAVKLLPDGVRPQLMEFASYHRLGDVVETGAFLPNHGSAEIVRRLDPCERARKERMLACFRTQAVVLRPFRTDEERFRLAPAYDFTQPPHAGQLYYEQFPWGMTAERWLGLARAAWESLGLC